MTMTESNKEVNWSELCPDLLRGVFERLSFTDLNRAKSVCSSWHSASRGCIPKRNQIPWLILFPREEHDNKTSCMLFIPDDRERVYRTRDLGVDFVRSCCLATYGSWLLMMDPKWNLNILNPLTGERIDLPLTDSESCGPVLKSSLACLWVDEKSKDYLVVWMLDLWFQIYAKKGNDRWGEVPSEYWVMDPTQHMVYNHKAQKLYVIRSGRVNIWCFRGDEPQQILDRMTFSYAKRFSLTRKEEDEIEEGWSNITTSVSGKVIEIYSVMQPSTKRWLFCIHRTQDLTNNYLDKMASLGDEALILDMGINVVAKDTPGIKRNSIYFSGIGYGRENPDHIFVYDLTTHKMEPLPQCVYSSINFSDARWFFPGLSEY